VKYSPPKLSKFHILAINLLLSGHNFYEIYSVSTHLWVALSKLSDVPFLPSKDCWSTPCICCVASHCFKSAPYCLPAPLVVSTLLNGGAASVLSRPPSIGGKLRLLWGVTTEVESDVEWVGNGEGVSPSPAD